MRADFLTLVSGVCRSGGLEGQCVAECAPDLAEEFLSVLRSCSQRDGSRCVYEAHELGEGARFIARFNRDGGDAFSKPFSTSAVVRRLHDGVMRGRRGIYADNTLALGPCAAVQLDGITVVVISNRVQCADPVFFEAFGLDIAAARVVVVKSRGHFRGGFDEFFRHDQVIEVDAPGLTSPVLSRFDWQHMPRPVLPIDDAAEWSP